MSNQNIYEVLEHKLLRHQIEELIEELGDPDEVLRRLTEIAADMGAEDE